MAHFPRTLLAWMAFVLRLPFSLVSTPLLLRGLCFGWLKHAPSLYVPDISMSKRPHRLLVLELAQVFFTFDPTPFGLSKSLIVSPMPCSLIPPFPPPIPPSSHPCPKHLTPPPGGQLGPAAEDPFYSASGRSPAGTQQGSADRTDERVRRK